MGLEQGYITYSSAQEFSCRDKTADTAPNNSNPGRCEPGGGKTYASFRYALLQKGGDSRKTCQYLSINHLKTLTSLSFYLLRYS